MDFRECTFWNIALDKLSSFVLLVRFWAEKNNNIKMIIIKLQILSRKLEKKIR